MSTDYLSKEELKDAIHIAYQSLDQEFDGIENSQRDNRMEGVDRTPAEIIAYQLGWLNLVMKWDKDEKAGLTVITPSRIINGINLADYINRFIIHMLPTH